MIIALAGLPRVGKDTFAQTIINYYGEKNVVSYAFAKPFKDALHYLFGWSYESMENGNKEAIDPKYGISIRQGMEYIGTDIMRKDIRKRFPGFDSLIGENIWANRAVDFLQENSDKTVIITDLRHKVEYEMLLAKKAYLIYIERPYFKELNTKKMYDIAGMKFHKILSNNMEDDLPYFKSKVMDAYGEALALNIGKTREIDYIKTRKSYNEL